MRSLRSREAVALVARREMTQKLREKSFLVSMGVTVVIIVLVAVIPPLLGVGGPSKFTVATTDVSAAQIATAARASAPGFDARLTVRQLSAAKAQAALDSGDVDAILSSGGLRSKEQPDDKLTGMLDAAAREVHQEDALRSAGLQGAELQRALHPPTVKVSTVKRVDPERNRKGAFAFVAVLALYTQLLTFGYLLASGVVEEKSSRVVEVLLSTIQPRDLLAGKIIGLGLLGLAQLAVLATFGLVAAGLSGGLHVSGDVISATALAVGWFVLGYAFYSGLFACAGALVPRQEELQASMTPLTMLILISFFCSFAVLSDPSGTLAHVTSFIPFSAPITMPPRIALGEAPPLEIVAALVVTLAGAIVLIPLAARIYSGAVLRTGSAVKVREAWRASAERA